MSVKKITFVTLVLVFFNIGTAEELEIVIDKDIRKKQVVTEIIDDQNENENDNNNELIRELENENSGNWRGDIWSYYCDRIS